MSMDEAQLQQAMDKAKIAMMSSPNSAFVTTVCLSLKFIWDKGIPTACTDGKSIRFSPAFFESLTPPERLFLLLHETWHVCFMHMGRLLDREPRRWNIAADHVINLMLIAAGFKMPGIGLADPKYTGMSTDEVYNLLTTEECEKTPVDMDLQMPEDMSPEAVKELEDIIIRAAIQSKSQGDKIGTIPGEVQIFLDNLLAPKLPWHRILQRYIQAKAKNDYTYRKPNRRYWPAHYLPSMYSENLMDLAIAVDTSGSVSDEEFKQFVSEVANILSRMKPEKITLVQFDTAIHSVTKIRNVSGLMQCSFVGRGGTDVEPVLDWAKENKPQLLLIFSDGGFRFKTTSSKTDTLWVIHNNPQFTVPFGKLVHYTI